MSADALSRTLHAPANPTRRAIVARLMDGERSVQELAEPPPMSRPAVSKHLKVLEDAGLVERRREAQRRYRRLRAEPLKDVAKYAFTFREYWEESFERLDELPEAGKARTRGSGPKAPRGKLERDL